MKHRVCYWPSCVTIISSYNPGPYCWTHTPDIGSKLNSTYKLPHVMSERFLANITGAYDITPEDRRRMKEGGG